MMAARMLVGLADLLAVDEQVTQPLGRAHELGGDDEHQAEAEAGAQRDQQGRQHGGQQDPAHHAEPRRAGTRGRPRRACGRSPRSRAIDAEIDREEHADRDQRHLRRLEDAEPQDEQRHPGDRRDGAQRLQRRIDRCGAAVRRAGQRADDRAGGDAEAKAGERRAAASPICAQSSPERASSASVAKIARGRRHQPALRPARTARRASQPTASAERQDEAEQPARRRSARRGAATRGRLGAGRTCVARRARAAGRSRQGTVAVDPSRSRTEIADYCVADGAEMLRLDQRIDGSPSRRARPSITPACCRARPAATIVSTCGGPIGTWVSSVRSSWRAMTGSGSLVAATRLFAQVRDWRAT